MNNSAVLTLLKNWNNYAKKDIYKRPGDDTLESYGPGYGGWAVQTNQKAIASFAMAGIKGNDAAAIETALKLLRFSLESHIAGSVTCSDGKKWGHSWISTLGLERAMHAINALNPYMTEKDKALLRDVLISEADWIYERYGIFAGLYDADKNNRPESDAWNGAFLYRVATMYPDALNAEGYIEKAEKFLFNVATVSSDSTDPLYVGSNFFDSMALNHHGYMNVGYMVITLSQIAMLHFYCKDNGVKPPKNLYHNADKLWKMIKTCTAPDGRLMRIGGDSRIRYCYCQDYAIPVWLFAKDYFGDKDADGYIDGWLKIVQKETRHNGDGSFLSARCYKLHDISPIYYTRLESDRACALSMLLAWDADGRDAKAHIDADESWYDEYHGSVLIQDESNMRSFTWRGANGPVGLCFPKEDTSLAEWDKNAVGEVEGIGLIHEYELIGHSTHEFDGGFATAGKNMVTGKLFLAEQQKEDLVALENTAYAALPDKSSVVVLQYAYTPDGRCTIVTSVTGMNVKIPNDLYNGCKRKYYFEKNDVLKEMGLGTESVIEAGKWINTDNKLGVYKVYGNDITLYSSGKRSAGIVEHPESHTGFETGSLYCDLICSGFEREGKIYWDKNTLIDCGFVITCDGAMETGDRSAYIPRVKVISDEKEFRYAEVLGRDGKTYLFMANFSDAAAKVRTEANGSVLTDLYTGDTAGCEFEISAGDSKLFLVR